MYTVALSKSAKQDLAALDMSVARRITQRLHWLGEHFEEIHPEALVGGQGDFKFRVGDYRVLYEIVQAEKLLRVYRVRHRREVYKER